MELIEFNDSLYLVETYTYKNNIYYKIPWLLPKDVATKNIKKKNFFKRESLNNIGFNIDKDVYDIFCKMNVNEIISLDAAINLIDNNTITLWSKLDLKKKKLLLKTSGWAIIMEYKTNDRDIRAILEELIECESTEFPRHVACKLMPFYKSQYMFNGNIHYKDCLKLIEYSENCVCYESDSDSEMSE